MAISKQVRLQMNESSWIRKMFEEGLALRNIHGADKVFDLSLGNPLLEPPIQFRQAMEKIINDEEPGKHRYMPNAGFDETRSAVAKHLSKETGLTFEANDIIMTVGAAGALNIALRSILDANDEVIIFAPYFAEYVFYIQHQTGTVRIAMCNEQFQPNISSLKEQITKKTRAVIINTPNNPTGVIYSKRVIQEIGLTIQEAEVEYGTEIYLISDEPYRKLIYSKQEYPFVFEHHPRTIVVTSHSKDLGLAGERIGYLAVNPMDPGKSDLIDACVFSLRTLGFVNAPALMQRAIVEIQDATVNLSLYQRKRDFIFGALTKMGYDCVRPDGAFYIFPKTPIPDDTEFVRLLQSKLVLTVPGIGFGTSGYLRASYCVEDNILEGSLWGFESSLKEVLG